MFFNENYFKELAQAHNIIEKPLVIGIS